MMKVIEVFRKLSRLAALFLHPANEATHQAAHNVFDHVTITSG